MIKQYPVQKVDLSNGETMAYRSCGKQGKTLILLHGNQSSSFHFQPLMETLENHFQIFTPDLIGFGDSSYCRKLTSLHDMSIDIALFMKQLKLDDAIVLGWSTGGGVALELAADHPELVAQLILLDSVGLKGYPLFAYDENNHPILTQRVWKREDVAKDPVAVKPVLDAFATNNRAFMKMVWGAVIYNLFPPSAEDLDQYMDATFKQRNLLDVDTALAQFNITHDFNGAVEGNGRIDKIKQPILIIHGKLDLVVPLANAEETKQYFGGQAKLVIIPDAGHSVITDDLVALTRVITNEIS